MKCEWLKAYHSPIGGARSVSQPLIRIQSQATTTRIVTRVELPLYSFLFSSDQRDELDLLAAALDLELIAGLYAQPGGLGLPDHQVAIEMDFGGIAEAAARLPLAATAAGAKVHTFCFQQRPIKGGEVQPLHADLFGADIAGGTNQIRFRDIAEFPDLGEQFSSDEHGEWLGMMDLLEWPTVIQPGLRREPESAFCQQ
jgi:hypothetical protein